MGVIMSNYAIIENGIVVNTVVAEADFADSQGWVKLEDGVGIGWEHDGNVFKNPNALTEQELLALKAESLREQRNQLLIEQIDVLNPLRWESMDTELQDSWRTYRQALLDVPQQEGFPEVVTWPPLPQ